MNIKKIVAAAAAAIVAVSAMAVSAFAEAHVKLEDSAELQGSGAFVFAEDITSNEELPEDAPEDAIFFEALLPEDVITVTITTDIEDTSDWFIVMLGVDVNDEGLQGVYSEFGGLTLTTTLKQIMDANGFAYEDIYALVLGVEGPEDDEVYTVSLSITGESAEGSAPGEGSTPVEGSTPEAGNTTGAGADPSKGSPDTGVEGVAVVAGIAVVAAGAIVVAKKRG